MSKCPVTQLTDLKNFEDGAPYELFAQLRGELPVYWEEESVSAKGGHWNVFRKVDIDTVMKNPAVFSNASGPSLEDTPPELLEEDMQSLNLLDPPRHGRNRAIIDYAFKPEEARKRESQMREIVRNLIEGFIDRGKCEFVSEFAAPVPIQVTCEILGIPEQDRRYVYDLVNTSVLANDPDYSSDRNEGFVAHAKLIEYGGQLASDHRRHPRASLTMEILQSEHEGEALSDHEYALLFHNLIVGGIETTRNAIAFGLHELIRHPDQYAMMQADPSIIPHAVEEILRYRAPVIYFRRTATEDTELAGNSIRKGDSVLCWLASANRDESSFKDPDVFDITRNQRESIRKHYRTFGVGPHFCIGIHLARLELIVVFEEICARLNNIRLLSPPRHVTSMFMDGCKAMEIAFDARR